MSLSTGFENSSTSSRPPGLSTRAIERRAAALSVQLRSPKPMVTQWKLLSAKGSCSALASRLVVRSNRPASTIRRLPTSSISRLMSVCATSPSLPTSLAIPRVRSPVPAATSKARSPGRRPVWRSVKCFHSR